MRICVLVKEVPAASSRRRIDPETGRLDRSGEGTLNPFDAHAVEAALALREGGGGGIEEVVVVTMGPPTATRALHRAVSRGADRAVLLTDPALAGSDVNGTSYALARVLAREQPDIVLLGQQSGDAECYVMAGAIGERLGMPWLTQVSALSLRDGTLVCERQAEFGYDTVELPPPAVVAVTQDLNDPRYPSLQAIMAARRKPLDVLDAAAAGIDAARVGHANARALCTDFADPQPRAPARILRDRDTERTVAEIVSWLDERRLLG